MLGDVLTPLSLGKLRWPALWCAALTAASPSCEREYECTPSDAQSLYAQRILPVLTDDRPKSCNQCHLSGVDLSLYVKATPCQTMACLVEEGVVNLDAPDDSLVLQWIARAKPESEGITADVIQEEYDGFREWIEYTQRCGRESCPSYDDPCERQDDPAACASVSIEHEWEPFDDPGGCDDIVLEEMFQNDFYAFRGRCGPCHWSSHPDENDDAPKWLQIGSCDTASLATLREIERRGFIDVEMPRHSLLFLKPLAEDLGGLEHGGGDKFHDLEEKGVVALLHFLERYADCHR
jgi:hypothetical protein